MTTERSRIAIDTNVPVYAEGWTTAIDVPKIEVAIDVLRRLPADRVVLPVQVLGELYRVLTRKAKLRAETARRSVTGWERLYPVAGTTPTALQAAIDLSATHGLGIWDSVIMSVAREAGCRWLLTEDGQDGFTWRGLTLVNPFQVGNDDSPLRAVMA